MGGAGAGSLSLIHPLPPSLPSPARETGLYEASRHRMYALQQSVGPTGEGCARHSLSLPPSWGLGTNPQPPASLCLCLLSSNDLVFCPPQP